MKKAMTMIAISAITFMPFYSTEAQSNEPSFWTTLAKTASLENAKSLESIYGSFEIDDGGDHLMVNYQLNSNTLTHQTNNVSGQSQISTQITIENLDAQTSESAESFKKIDALVKGHLISHDQKDLYLRLDDLIVNVEGADEGMMSNIEGFKAMAEAFKDQWYHINLDEVADQELANLFDRTTLMTNFKKNPKMAIRDVIESAVRESAKQNQYYNSFFNDTETTIVDPSNQWDASDDYQSYLTDEVKQHPIDLKGLVEKGVLTCDQNPNDQTLQSGFQYPNCWPSVYYNGSLTDEESTLINELYANEGVWIYENNHWYYVNDGATDATDESDSINYDNIVSPEAFDYDESAIDAEVVKTMQGVDLLLNTNFFDERDIVLGPNQGFKFFNLNRGVTVQAIKNFAITIGEKLSDSDEGELRSTIGKISFSGIYYIRPDNDLLESLHARFKINHEEFVKNFTLNYKYKLMDYQTENKITIPSGAKELSGMMQ